MKAQTYSALIEQQRKEIEDFPIVYAFNDEQLAKALDKLGAKDTSECVTVFGHGDIVRKPDAPKLMEMMKRHTKELHEALKNKEFAYEAFLYEMNNHEYCINWDADDDVLSCFALDFNDLKEMNLLDAYNLARKEHYRVAHEEWEII